MRVYLNSFSLLLALFAFAPMLATVVCAEPDPDTAASYGKIPLSFEANRGQTNAEVRFASRGKGYAIYLTDTAAVLAFGKDGDCTRHTQAQQKPCAAPPNQHPDIVCMTLAGAFANHNPLHFKAVGEDELPGKVNYFLGNDPSKWHAGLPTYARVHYSGVYPGVDVMYYGNKGQLEYDFIVAPGASTDPIRLRFSGEKHLSLAANGDLILQGTNGSAIVHKPLVYQGSKANPRSIRASFYLTSHHDVGFKIGRYDHTRRLIIDPVLVYSTYLGGSGSGTNGDQGNGIAVDSTGHAYIVGTTPSVNFPLGTTPIQTQNYAAPANTVFVTKMNAYGTGILYSTYLGGSGGDSGNGIAIDSAGNAYITGTTYSHDFPVTCGAFETANPSTTTGAPTSFIAKLDFHGSTLLYASYLGGSGNHAAPAYGDVSQAIAVDAHNSAYVTGYTFSSDFPTTDTAFQQQNHGSPAISNAFVTKLNAAGTALAYSTYLGGAGSNGTGDYANAIALDASGDAFITGSTASANFPVTSGAFQTTMAGTQPVGFVTKLNATGTDQIYSTYTGGTGGDSAQAIAVDSTGAAYFAGNTFSNNFPITAGTIEGTENPVGQYFGPGGGGAFASKLSSDGTALVYSTYLEGVNATVSGMTLDGAGNAYIVGSTPNPSANPVGYGGFQNTPDSIPIPVGTVAASSAYLVELDPMASSMKYATLLAGNGPSDNASGVALDLNGNAYLTGSASSSNFPTTKGAFQTKKSSGANSNVFVSKLALASEANHTTYPLLPSSIGTFLAINSGQSQDCASSSYSIDVSVVLDTNAFGPPPTGTLEIDFSNAFGADNFSTLTNTSWGGGDSFAATDEVSGGFTQDVQMDWGVAYSGDSLYLASSGGGTSYFTACPYPQYAPGTHSNHPLLSGQSRLQVAPGKHQFVYNPKTRTWDAANQAKPSQTEPMAASVHPKYSPEPANATVQGQQSSIRPEPDLQQSPACIAPSKPTLTVTVSPGSRAYGSANPTFTYTVAGLLKGDTVTVNYQTTATKTSPAGQYPITATIAGPPQPNITPLLWTVSSP